MKISICIPQYNRIAYLKIALLEIEQQDYPHIEICIADDASTDQTPIEIEKLKKHYKFPIHYYRFISNQGYDRNLRRSMELATGDYCFILGNDDSLNGLDAVSKLVDFIQKNNLPDVGFCNVTDYLDRTETQIRAKHTQVIGAGVEVALQYYSSFSFVAGLIFKKITFDKYNTSKYDKSIYVQIYLATVIMANGGVLFTISDPLVAKDIRVNNDIANSYRDTLPRKFSDFKALDAGLPSYSRVAFEGITQFGKTDKKRIAYKILKRLLLFTYPFWLIDYRANKALVASLGLVKGLSPKNFSFYQNLSAVQKFKIGAIYNLSTIGGVTMPIPLFRKLRSFLYRIAKN